MAASRDGVVLGGKYSGWKIIVEDDRDGDTGGYYLYLKKSVSEGFDYWFESESALKAQLAELHFEWY